ncbi:ribonuclease E/G [Pelagibius marinus]|uniref:ribonuclease E/G n=1 Tax=Pelagibius marinus TaxID=2762760 RepID=UPI001872F535|nr:ribonuclease E/G [Pelagibius marinus]
MTAELFVSVLPGETRGALLRDDLLDELLILRDDAPPQAGDLFLARVQRFDKGLDGAFVDLGLERPGLLPRREMPEGPGGGVPPEGTALAVKVLRAPAEDKGARVSAKGISALAIKDLKAPARLGGGALVAVQGPLATLVARAAPQRVVCDDAALLKQLKDLVEGDCDFDLHSSGTPLFEAEGLEAEIEGLLSPRAELPSGGFLLVEPGRTLTAIDVNAGASDGRGGAEAQAKAVNLAAVPVIARQLRLRGLSGLIVVDFLAMKNPLDRKAVAAALRQAVADDPEPCQVFGVSPSGLLEMTRRRGRLPLHEILCRPCGFAGSGREKTPETLAYEALRATVAGALGQAVSKITLRAAPPVAAALKAGQAGALAAVERRLGRPVHVAADPLVETYELVLG